MPLAPVIQPEFIGGNNAGISTWHLSVVNGGVPRGIRSGETLVEASATMFNVSTWTGAKLDEAQWMLVGQVDEPATMPLFGAAHATRLDLEARPDVFDRLLEDLQRIVGRLLLHDVERLIHDALRGRALAPAHDRADELRDERTVVNRVRGNFTFWYLASSWHTSGDFAV